MIQSSFLCWQDHKAYASKSENIRNNQHIKELEMACEGVLLIPNNQDPHLKFFFKEYLRDFRVDSIALVLLYSSSVIVSKLLKQAGEMF